MDYNQKVSIVVPVFNAEKFLGETITCVRNQTYQNWELLLVDDCSNDGSRELIREWLQKDERIRLILLNKNAGAANARNQGVMQSLGRYIAFLDADDLWLSGKLEAELSFQREKNAAFVFTGYEYADEEGKGLGKVVRVPKTLNYRQALKNTTIFTTTTLFDTELIPKELLLMPDIKSEDTATWWRILRSGYTAYGLNENLALYRRSAGTLSSNKLEAVRRIWKLYRETEKLSIAYSAYNFIFYAVRAVRRRV